MDRPLLLVSPEFPALVLRGAGEDDLENLRVWKNSNRESFFFRDTITPEMQTAWFAGYRKRDKDFMFIVRAHEANIGCMAVRLLGETWDIYNVILGKPEEGKKGWMSAALRMMCTYVWPSGLPIRLKVLCANPAVRWYLRNGFCQVEKRPDHLLLALDRRMFRPCALLEGAR